MILTKTNRISGTVLALLALFVGLHCNAEDLAVFARQKESTIEFEIVNISKSVVILGNPLKSGIMLSGRTDRVRGGLNGSVNMSSFPWKHLIFLLPKADGKPHLSSHKFEIHVDRNKEGHLKELEVRIWATTEPKFRKEIETKGDFGIFPPLEHVEIKAVLIGQNHNNGDALPAQDTPEPAPTGAPKRRK